MPIFNAGFTLGSPSTSKSISREARIRFGYFKKFEPGWTIDLFFEKRSFNFSDPKLPDLYTKAKRVGGLLGTSSESSESTVKTQTPIRR